MKKTLTLPSQQRLLLGRRQIFQGTALATGLSLPVLLGACGEGLFPASPPKLNFVFINHAYNDHFFDPVKYGSDDAAMRLGCSKPQWTGATTADQFQDIRISKMLAAFNLAINLGIQKKVDGIAVSIIDRVKFNDPVERALRASIPVISYNADAPPESHNQRKAYIGQNLRQSGLEMGMQIHSLVPTGKIVCFIATPGDLNTQPRMDGVTEAMRKVGRSADFESYQSDTDPTTAAQRIDDYFTLHRDVKGFFAVDGSSTAGVAKLMEKHGLRDDNAHAGGYDLLESTLQAVVKGHLDFTIDQQPYMQGYMSVLELFQYKYSEGRVSFFDVSTGINFIKKKEAMQYLDRKTRFEGLSETLQDPPSS